MRHWTLLVTADREYHAQMDGWATSADARVPFPSEVTYRAVALHGDQLLIGRRGGFPDLEPDIDLTGPPADPRVSPAHALLLANPDGGWSLVDLGSANGTYLNDALNPIATNYPVPLYDGDAIHLGAWTTLTLSH